jgi:hypothetical protein
VIARTTQRFFVTLALGVAAVSGCMKGETVGGGSAWNGPSFSAEMVDPDHPDKPMSRIWLGEGKLRLESLDTGSIGAIVLDPAHGRTLIVNDRARSYIDAGFFTSLVTVGFAPLMRVLRPAGPGDPCSQWNNAINPFRAFARDDSQQPPQYTCRSLGADAVNGRLTQKWAVTSNDPDEGPMTIWIDDRLHIMSRSQDKGGTMEMRDVQEGAQPDSLFTPPVSYRKLTLTSIVSGMLHGAGQDSAASGFLDKLRGAAGH